MIINTFPQCLHQILQSFLRKQNYIISINSNTLNPKPQPSFLKLQTQIFLQTFSQDITLDTIEFLGSDTQNFWGKQI